MKANFRFLFLLSFVVFLGHDLFAEEAVAKSNVTTYVSKVLVYER